MGFNFAKFEQRNVKPPRGYKVPTVVVRPNRVGLGFSRSAVRAFDLENIYGLVFYWDSKNRAIGMEICIDPTENAYKISDVGHCGCAKFLREIDIPEISMELRRDEETGFLYAIVPQQTT